MKKLLLPVLLLLLFSGVSAQVNPDSIERTNGVIISCRIDSITHDAAYFHLGTQTNLYKIYKTEIARIYSNGSWQTLQDTFTPTPQTIPSTSSASTVMERTPLEKAGRNLIAATVTPLACGVLALPMISTDTKEGRTIGFVLLAGGGLTAVICSVMAGTNLIEAQRMLDNRTSSLRFGGQQYGLGVSFNLGRKTRKWEKD